MNKLKRKSYSISILTLTLFCLTIIKAFSNTSLYMNNNYYTFFKLLSYMTYIALLICCFRIPIKKKKFAFLSLLCLLLGIATIYSENIFLLVTFVAIMSINEANYYTVVRAIFYASIISFFVIVGLHLLGIFPSVDKIQNGTYRTSLGFRHVNTCGLYMLAILLMGITLYFNKWKKKYYIYTTFVFLTIYITCKSMTSLLCGMLSVVLLFVFKKWGNFLIERKLVRICIYLLTPMCFLATYFSAKYYSSSELLKYINVLMTNRIFLNSVYFQTGTVSLFSKPFIMPNWYLDSAYANLILFNGVVPSTIYTILNIFNTRKAIKEREFGVIICIIIFSIYALSEIGALYFWFNVSILYILSINFPDRTRR